MFALFVTWYNLSLLHNAQHMAFGGGWTHRRAVDNKAMLIESAQPESRTPVRTTESRTRGRTNKLLAPVRTKQRSPAHDEGTAMADTNFVEVYRAKNSVDAHFLKNALEDAGISSQITDESAASMRPDLWWTSPRLLVAETDAAKAAAIIREIEASRLGQSRQT
jgi:hypothetical protein